MSKHVRRIRIVKHYKHGECICPGAEENCTVIEDDARIPIQEVLAVVKATEAWYRIEEWDSPLRHQAETQMCIAMGKYHVAVERLQRKRKARK